MSYHPPAGPPPQLPPAGWFTDPDDGSQYRYWDGYAWTEHRSPRGGAAVAGASTAAVATVTGSGGGLRGPSRLISDAFALTRRQWQPVAAAVGVGFAGQVAAAVLLFVTLNSIFGGGLLVKLSDVAEPDFAAIDLDFSALNLVPLVFGVAIMWAAAAVSRAAMPHIVVEDLAGRPVSAGGALAHGSGRALRVAGLDVQIGLLTGAAMLVVVLPSSFVPLLALLLYPAWVAALVYSWVVTTLAHTAVSVSAGEPPLRHALGLVKGHFWGLLGRLLLVNVVVCVGVFVVLIIFAIGAAGLGSGAVTVALLVLYVLLVVAAAAVATAAAAICYWISTLLSAKERQSHHLFSL